MKATVLGWYGHGNAGDESYKLTFPRFFRGWDLTFTDKMNDSDTVILGGGHVVLPDFLRQIVNVPNKYMVSATVAADASFDHLRSFKKIFVRDIISQKHLRDNGISSEVLPDMAFLLQPNPEKGKIFIENAFKGKDLYKNVIVVVLNAYLAKPYCNFMARDFVNFHSVVEQLTRIIDSVPASFLFLSFGQEDPADDRVTNSWLASRCKFWSKNVVVYDKMSPQTLLDVISCADAVISSRLHSSIFSCICGTPFIDLTHHTKNSGFIETINREDWSIPYWHFNYEKCENLLKSFLGDKTHREALTIVSRHQTDRINDVSRLQ